ncbi:hybrid sensor histidine kinase/response regulator transcription factor [Chitinophaga vietnamensis]|uniref:hybrid sensor histidine kinase/response regulator transcription factor n=1 Tax=Chitinophaga vietnamensis TaxID=2593957 RepID=UPI001177D414|nr:two-component regulator propeller domain-containing protein [Chitinophaga vietnamensis]
MSRFLSFIGLCLICHVLHAQHILFDNLTTENGLSQNAVLSICQDSRGFMWYGTQNGLNKYDTRGFKIYRNQPADSNSLSSNYITCLLQDRHQRLWIGTRNGLNRYCPETDNFKRAAVPAGAITCIYEDHAGHIWVWAASGLFQLDAHDTFVRLPLPDSIAGLGGINVRSIYQDHTGMYWLGTSAGLTAMTADHHFHTYHHTDAPNSLSDDYVTCFTEDAAKRLWVGTLHGGVNLFHRDNNTFSRFTESAGASGPVNNNIRVLQCDSTGAIWIGTLGGLSLLDPAQQKFTHCRHDPEDKNSLSHNSIYSIFIDHQATVWIGTFWGGINSVAPYGTSFHVFQAGKYHPGINNNVVSSLWEDRQHNLWVGTEGNGLNFLDRQQDQVTLYRQQLNDPSSLGSNLIKVIYGDREGNIWVGTHGGGLNLFLPQQHHFARLLYQENDPLTLSSEVLSLLEDDDNNFWIGTQNGLLIYKKNGAKLQQALSFPFQQEIGKKAVKAILQAHDQSIWLGTSEGLYHIDHLHKKLQAWTRQQGLPGNDINCLYEDEEGNIWAGFYYDGLARVHQDSITVFTEKNGLCNNNVMAILGEGRQLWISTSNGLSRFNIDTREFKSYYKSDGLRGNTFNVNSCLRTSSGEMLFGGFNGLTSFYPSQIESNNWAPPIVITRLKVFNQPVSAGGPDGLLQRDISLTDHLTFSHKQNAFTLEFAALNYIRPNKNRYAYKLSGFDDDWNYTSTPSATYMNLPPGNYTFLVKGANNDGVWSREAVLHLQVRPPFWKTVWAYALYVLLASTLIFFIVRYFLLQALLKKDQELTRFKLSFFTNISHEIRTHLSLINGPVDELVRNNNGNEHTQRQLQTIKTNADSLLQLVTELMDFRKAETGHLVLHVSPGNVVAFLRNIYQTFHALSVAKNISMDFSATADNIRLYFDNVQLEKVCYNLLSNAFKFTPVGGHISMAVEEHKDTVVITITDNGKGIAPENLDKLFSNYFQEDDQSKNTGYGIGLALAKSIVETHRGSISAASSDKTVFKVTLPKGRAHFPDAWVSELTQETAPTLLTPVVPASATAPAPSTEDHACTVLLVEDNAEIRHFICRSLSGYRIIESANGREGLEMATTLLPDIIISDVMMPEMDGYTLCEQLKSNTATSHIPVILLTAMSTQANHISGLKMGADIYLTKPFSMQVLQLHLHNLLQLRTRMQEWVKQQLALPVTATPAPVAPMPLPLEDEFLQKVVRIIEENIDEPEFGVGTLSQQVNMSHPVLYKKLDALTGMSVNDFIKAIRFRKATELLTTKKYTIAEVAYMVGFSDRKYFSKEFKKHFGKTPSEFIEYLV